jgi:uncharacterized membrane protein
MSLARLTYVAILLATVLWCTALLAAPLLVGAGWSSGDLIYASFHRVCHQLEGRSLFIGGHPLAACARCSSIYLGFLCGVLLYPLFRRVDDPVVPSRWFVIIAALPMLADVLSGFLGMHETTLVTRMVSGSVFGLLIPFVIIPVASEAVVQLIPQRPMSVHQEKGTSDA